MEIWKNIHEFEGYQVSNTGRVKTIDRIVTNARATRKLKGKIKPLRVNKYGYVDTGLSSGKTSATRVIHRIVLEAFVGKSNGLQCNHRDGDRTNNNLSNLEWVTQSENMLHSYNFNKRIPSMKGKFSGDHVKSKLVLNKVTGIYYGSIKEASLSINRTAGYLARMLSGSCTNRTDLILV